MVPKNKGQQGGAKPKVEADRKILVAVDFGTTYSGLAWAQTRKPDTQTPVIQWPDATSGNREGVTKDKVPTELQYEGENYKWGSQIANYGLRHQWFKLALDPENGRDVSELAAKYQDPLAAPPDYERSAEKLTTDYLTALREHAEHVLRNKLPQGALMSTLIEYIITVPAVWSEAAQAKTRACAEKGGMGVGSALHIISEPEAAAMYALDIMDPHNVQVGDTFVLCDAGGGTVDLISYTVTALKPVLRLTEASPGTGSACGSSFLNRTFHKFLEKKIGGQTGWDDEVLEEAMKHFNDAVKQQFRGTFGEEFFVPVSGLQNNVALGIRRGKLRLDGGDVRAMFEPILREVLRLVLSQVKASERPIKAVLLVGGFGQNAYLRDSIRGAVASMNIEVMQCPNAWTAVVRGALMKGLASTSPSYSTVSIGGRYARRHYGVETSKVFIEGVHDRNRRVWNRYYGKHTTPVIEWFLKKGEIVEDDKPNRIPYCTMSCVSDGPFRVIGVTITVASDPRNTGAPMYLETGPEATTRELVEVQADLSRIPAHRYRQQRGADENLYYIAEFAIEVTYYSAYTKYELIHDGINYGLVASEYV